MAEWQGIWKREILIYTVHHPPQGSSPWAYPKVMCSADFYPIPTHPLGLFSSASTTPGLLELLFGREQYTEQEPAQQSLVHPLAVTCARGLSGFRAVGDGQGQGQGQEQGWTRWVLPDHHTHPASLREMIPTGLFMEMSPATPLTPITVCKNHSMKCLSKWACHNH